MKDVEAKGATVTLEGGMEGYVRASDISRDRVEDARTVLKEGEEIEAKFVGVDRRNRMANLSIKAKDQVEEQRLVQDHARPTGTAGTTALGDLLKEQLGEQNDDR